MVVKDRIAIVTGAGSGIGAATARALHTHGAYVVATDVSGKEADTAQSLGDRAVAFRADLSNPDEIAALIEFAVSEYDDIDILCNVGALGTTREFLADARLGDFERIINVDLVSVFLTMKHAIPHMVRRGGGSIVNVSSMAALKTFPNMAAYASAKAGVVALTKVAAMEYGEHGIRVNVICPGATETPLLLDAHAANPARLDYLRGLAPLRRMGLPEEMASVILFLASEASSYITGAVVPVDGGQSM
ncbi:MAG: SDR family NAD(P)-dependent oxidoreductase [Novosphingobium sp.]|nr:SDR family NAD(P)-dependent oxidoreductase [Novosphingobium sp.]